MGMSAFYLGIFIAMFLLVMIFGVYLQSVFGDEYGTLGIRHPTNPIVCVFEPDPSHTKNVGGVMKSSYTAIDLWKEGLAEHSPEGNWDMTAFTIPFEHHDGKNASEFPVCDILIAFEHYNPDSSSLGYTYIDFSSSNHKYAHIVVYLYDYRAIDHYNFVLGSQEQVYKDTTEEIRPFSLTAIQHIVTHEFGHALGLGHYEITDYPVYSKDKPWLTASVMYYSINPDDDDVGKPLYVDIKMVERLYGEDGFGGSIAPPLKLGYYTAGDTDICTHKCSITKSR